MNRSIPMTLILLVVSGSLMNLPAVQAKEPLGKKWTQTQRLSFEKIDHRIYHNLLQKYVDQNGYVHYSSWQKNKTDRAALQTYLNHLSRADLKQPASRESEIAFWINAYNAVTIEGILQVYPTSSIRNHTAKLFGYNIWKQLPLIVGDKQFSLDQIEHEILRKKKEPRIHFAIVCASVGCPRLLNEAYTGTRLESQLAGNAKDFFSRKQNCRFDSQTRTLYLSSILNWFGADFGATQTEQLQALRPWFPPQIQNSLNRSNVSLRYLDYDWALNDQSRLK